MGAKSIIVDDMRHCYVCGSSHVHTHHIMYGNANRSISDKYGLIVPLCAFHHNCSSEGVHYDHNLNIELRTLAEIKFKKKFPYLDFREIFGRSYL